MQNKTVLGKMLKCTLFPGTIFCVVDPSDVEWQYGNRIQKEESVILLTRNHGDGKHVENNFVTYHFYLENKHSFLEMTKDEIAMFNMVHPEYNYRHWIDLYKAG